MAAVDLNSSSCVDVDASPEKWATIALRAAAEAQESAREVIGAVDELKALRAEVAAFSKALEQISRQAGEGVAGSRSKLERVHVDQHSQSLEPEAGLALEILDANPTLPPILSSQDVPVEEKIDTTVTEQQNSFVQMIVLNEHIMVINVHAWAIIHATKRSTGIISSFIGLFMSIGFTVMQMGLLASVILEASFTRCLENSDCLTGEWCSPTLFGDITTKPGVCFDCWSATMMYNARFNSSTFPYETKPDDFERMALAAGDEWLRAGETYCKQTDKMPRHCDRVMKTLNLITPLNIFVFIVASFLIVAPIVDDVDHAAELDVLIFHRFARNPISKRQYLTMNMSWAASVLRRWVLPMLIVGASIGLLLQDSLSTGNILLNGIAVTFVTVMDDALGYMLFRPHYEAVDWPKLRLPIALWSLHRLYAICLVISLIVTLLDAERLLEYFGNERKHGAVCSDIREILTELPHYVCMFFSFIHGPVRYSLIWTQSDAAAAEDRYREKMCASNWNLPHFRRNTWYRIFFCCRFVAECGIPPLVVHWVNEELHGQGFFFQLQIGGTKSYATMPP